MFNTASYNSKPYNSLVMLALIIKYAPSIAITMAVNDLTTMLGVNPQTVTLSDSSEPTILR